MSNFSLFWKKLFILQGGIYSPLQNNLSSAELHLWEVAENNQEKIVDMSIIQLSHFANVSTATIVRTMKKMGYSGYTAYRENLKQNGNYSSKYKILNRVDSTIKDVILKNEIELNNTLNNLQINTIEAGIRTVQQAKIVYIFARGLSKTIAHEMQIKLQLSNKYTELFDDPNIIRILAKKITKECAVIFITLNGETAELVEAAQTLEKNDVPKITFTTNGNSSIIPYSGVLFLGFQSETTYFPEFEVSSRLPLNVMMRIFTDTYAIKTKRTKNT